MSRYWKSLAIFLVIYIVFWVLIWLILLPRTMIIGGSSFPYIFTLWVWIGGSIILPIAYYFLVHQQKRKQKETLDAGDWFFMIALTIFILLWGLLLPIEITLQTPGPHPQYSYSMNWLNLGTLVIAGIIVILGSVILKKKQKK